jgi:hypothetical protein
VYSSQNISLINEIKSLGKNIITAKNLAAYGDAGEISETFQNRVNQWTLILAEQSRMPETSIVSLVNIKQRELLNNNKPWIRIINFIRQIF